MEEKDDSPLSPQGLPQQFRPYDPKLDLSGYQYPTMDLLPESLRPLFQKVRGEYPNYKMPILLNGEGNILPQDLYHHPNVLLAGTIASGKTQFIYNQIIAWLYSFHPAELKLVIFRSKPVDYNPLLKVERHFLATPPDAQSPIAERGRASSTINSLVIECSQRLDLFQKAGVKTIEDYNSLFVNRELNPEQGHRYLPNIVLIMDDLQTWLDEQNTNTLISLTQQNLYTGIYLLAATSQIMARNITPQLRANFSIRLAMKLMSQNESRKILDRVGAERLNPPGELLYLHGEKLKKGVQPFIDYTTIQSICDFIGLQRGYRSAWHLPIYLEEPTNTTDIELSDRDDMFEEAARLIVMYQQGATSLIQRQLKLGYNRAGRIIDQLEAAGIIGPFEGSKDREVLYPDEYSLEQYLETLRNDNRIKSPIVPKLPELDTKPVVLQNNIVKPKKKPRTTKKSTPRTSLPPPPVLKNEPTSVADNSSKAHVYVVVTILVAIVALFIFLGGGWEGVLKWLSFVLPRIA